MRRFAQVLGMQIEVRDFEGERDEEVARKATAIRFKLFREYLYVYLFRLRYVLAMVSLRDERFRCRANKIADGLLKIVIDQARSD